MIDKIILEDIERIKRNVRKEDLEEKKVSSYSGAGFIGSWICDVLMSLTAEVTCLDNLSTGKMDYIDHLLDKPKFSVFQRGCLHI